MFIDIGRDDVGRQYSAGLYSPGCLGTLPWRGEPFDCVVFLGDPGRAQAVRAELSAELTRANVDWVQAAGSGAEELHDAIDRASVAVGRQQAVGDGSPMTSWHEEALTGEAMADLAAHCFGVCKRVLVLVVGHDSDLLAAVVAVSDRLTNRCAGPGAS